MEDSMRLLFKIASATCHYQSLAMTQQNVNDRLKLIRNAFGRGFNRLTLAVTQHGAIS